MLGAVLDHLWQSTLVLAIAGLFTLLLRNNSAQIRFWLWFAASVKFVVPFSALTALGRYLLVPVAPQVSAPSLFLIQPAAQPFSAPSPVLSMPAASEPNLTMLILLLWGAGSAVIVVWWLIRWSHLRKVLRDAVDLPLVAPVAIKMAASSLEPGLVGIWRPVILLPKGIFERLSSAEMCAIVAHEVCHFRRRDNSLAAIHMLVEALFWFYPPVWWLGARLNTERERACDESVLASGNAPQVYAESILKICKLYLQSPLGCVSGVSGANLKKRMDTIMENKFANRLNGLKTVLLATCAATVIAAPLALGLLTVPSAMAPTMAQTGDMAHPGTEAALRRQIEGWEKKLPVLQEMTPNLATSTIPPQAQKQIDDWGALKSITFKGNSPEGFDVYLVEFANGLSVWSIMPLVDGKIRAMDFQPVLARTGNGPSPGVEAMVRRYYDGILKGAPAYDIMGPGLFHATRQTLGNLEQNAKNLGALKTLAFTKVTTDGQDVYAATFDHGTATFTVPPLKDGLLNNILFFDIHEPSAKVHPGTQASLRRYIESLEKGQPNYDEMVPGVADPVKQDLVARLALIKSWGDLESIDFKGGGSAGTDVYDVTFKHGQAECRMEPLDTAGRVVFRDCWPLF